MKVTFSSSLWAKPEKRSAGRPQQVDWSYHDGSAVRYIPVVYRFAEGVVFDVLTPLDDDALQGFFARCAGVEEELLTDTERRCLEQEHPYGSPELWKCRINGGEPLEDDASGTLLFSDRLAANHLAAQGDAQEEALTAALRLEQKMLVGQSSFGCWRVRLQFGPSRSWRERLRRALRCYKVRELAFETDAQKRLYPVKLEMTESQGMEQGAVLQNPVTGARHRIYLSHIRREVFELPGGRAYYCSSAVYETDQPLPRGQRLVFDNTLPPPEPAGSGGLPADVPAAPPDGMRPRGRAAAPTDADIGVIGGADGPVAVFWTRGGRDAPAGAHGLPAEACMSVPSWDPRQSRTFRIAGVECVEREAQTIRLKL